MHLENYTRSKLLSFYTLIVPFELKQLVNRSCAHSIASFGNVVLSGSLKYAIKYLGYGEPTLMPCTHK